MLPKEGNRITDPGTEIANPRCTDLATIDDLLQLPDFVLGKILRTLAGDRHIGAVLVVIFIGEAIKLGLVHLRSTSRFRRVETSEILHRPDAPRGRIGA